ncbi:serine hydrolase domain-containing protein [Spirosoma sp. KUDC1026]|uniref:serine hydrolase domain-containing protein n=1 Tax=Spirosoma sp. KUDC1026 TaxID=2745947 RepID=UPI00159BBD61|nr:serine hydrolase domain-containing protein [Spirosoma sp. KUDC1026]QKZ13560.1 beta-lactamase family protein [Spirosoma sp. KUDC1026]
MSNKRVFFLLVMSWAFCANAQPVKQQIEKLVDTYAALGKFNGSILVAAQGKLLLNKGYGYKDIKQKTFNDPHTIYQIASLTKSFTATLILKLVESNRLALTDKVSQFYPDLPKGDSITIDQLLSHTSGLSDDDSNTRTKTYPGSEEAKFLVALRERPLDFIPGTDWKYSNAGYILLGYIIEHVSGMSYYEAVRTYLFSPLGMNHSGFDFIGLSSPNKATGYWEFPQNDTARAATLIDYRGPRAAGAIYSTTGDLYQWHQGLQGGKLISSSLLNRAYTPVKNNYGYGWMIDSVGRTKVVWHSGDIWGFKSELARVPADDICIIMLNNMEDVDLHIITRKILAILYHQPYQWPARTRIQLSTRVLQAYIGEYQLRPGEWIKVSLDGHRLTATTTRKQELYAQKEDYFLLDDGREQLGVVFNRNSLGLVTDLSFSLGERKVICPKKE